MAVADSSLDGKESRLRRLVEVVRRGFAEFLKVPLLIIGGFLLVAACTSILDYAEIGWFRPLRTAMREYFFRDAKATSDLLATVAGSMITVTSITFSLLLLAVQQAASALTHQVYDQFLRRRINQFYFGFFVGLAVYTLVILATVDQPYNPVIGATLALLLTVVALMLLILLLYTTINQMRPVVVIEAIHDFTLASRKRQLDWLLKTKRSAQAIGGVSTPVLASKHGYVVQVDIDSLGLAAKGAQAEVVLRTSVGAFVAFQDPLAEVRAPSPEGAAEVAKAVQNALRIEQQRDLATDPAYGIEQLAIIGWTSVSTAKSNPSPGLLVIHSLRDLLARWSTESNDWATADQIVPVIYTDDVFSKLLDAFETMAVVASESMQPQTMTEIVRTFASMFARLPVEHQARAGDLISRTLSALGEHVLTAELDANLTVLVQEVEAAGRQHVAAEVRVAQETLSKSVGKLGSRATRASEQGWDKRS